MSGRIPKFLRQCRKRRPTRQPGRPRPKRAAPFDTPAPLSRGLLPALLLVAWALGALAAPASATPGPRFAASTSDFEIPVVVYHVVTPTPTGRYQHDLASFIEGMAYLHDNGYTPLSAAQYYSVMTLQTPPPARPILLTFDDGTEDFATNVMPVLRQYGFPSVQFAVSDWIDTSGHLTSTQLEAAGIRMAFTVSEGKTTPSDDFLALDLIMIVNSDSVDDVIRKIS